MAKSDASSLGELAVGTRAVVRQVAGSRRLRTRVLELGLLPGTEIEVVRKAPLGDPLELRLRGYSLSLRKADAAAIEVQVLEGKSAELAAAGAVS